MSQTSYVVGYCCVNIIICAVTTIETLERTTISPNAYYNITHKLYFEVEQDGKELGNIIFGLYAGAVPKTVSNFRQIALMGITENLSYMGSRFYKIVPGVKIQGGDIINNDGSGQTSIWRRLFEDENFLIKHSEPGIVSMVNNGSNTNGCQFFITLKACPFFDGVHVAFGKIVKGMDVVYQIAKSELNKKGESLKPVEVTRIVGGMDIVYQIAKSQLDSDGEPRSPVIVTRIGELPVVGTDHPFYSWVQTDF